MKKLYFSLLTFLFFVVAHAQIVNIPDANFKAKLLAASSTNTIASIETPVFNASTGYWTVSSYNQIDTNNDGQIQVSEANEIKYLNFGSSSFSAGNISNVEGINSFTNIIFFDCRSNLLTSLNIQELTNLQGLDCSFNQLPSLNVEGLTNLQFLNCRENQIPSLNVQGITNLQSLDCSFNQIPTLNLQGLANLQTLACNNNQLTSLNLQGLTNLKQLNCWINLLPSLNVQGLVNLQYLYCYSNQLTSLNVEGLTNLQGLDCIDNQITSLNVQGLTNLQFIDCFINQLTSLNVQGLTNLQELNCANNQLTALFIKNNNVTNWEIFDFSYNPNLAYICADEEDLTFVQQKVDDLGYTNCQVDSNCSLSVLNNPLENNYFSIYPNPVKNELNLSTKQATTVYSLSIYNTLGQQVQTTTNPVKTIDVTGLKTGNYIVKVTTDKGISSSKFVKE